MGSRYATMIVGAVVLATTISYISVEPRKAAALTAVKTCGDGSIALKAREKRTLVLHNEARTDRGMRPLCVDPRLTRAARSHSREMIRKDYFSHSSYNGESVSARLMRFGYDCGTCGENIAGGFGTPARPGPVFDRWMGSPGHRANILSGEFRRVGVGTNTGEYKGTPGHAMYTIDFGGRG